MWEQIAQQIEAATGAPFELASQSAMGGGCINAAYRIEGVDGRAFFVKFNRSDLLDMFDAEAQGLEALAASQTVRVPGPICWGEAQGQAYLVLELLQLGGSGSMAAFGEQLAAMHRHTQPRFGWYRDNVIGSTHQPNGEMDDWVAFWRERRLGHQLQLAQRNGAARMIPSGERLMEHVGDFFTDYTPEPSLLHGDLWSGNYSFDRDGEPVIFDPAVYYGDREADLAMTELFGGFGSDFYAAYDAVWPIDPGYKVRRTLYNLYHIINHFNLFGGGYASQAERMIDQLLSEVR